MSSESSATVESPAAMQQACCLQVHTDVTASELHNGLVSRRGLIWTPPRFPSGILVWHEDLQVDGEALQLSEIRSESDCSVEAAHNGAHAEQSADAGDGGLAHEHEHEHKKVSFLELLYDLTFVFLITQLAMLGGEAVSNVRPRLPFREIGKRTILVCDPLRFLPRCAAATGAMRSIAS